MLDFAARSLFLGMTLSGKSTLAVALAMTAPGPRLLLDPGASDVCDVPGARTITDPKRLCVDDVVRFVPSDPFDMDMWDAAYRWALDHCRAGGHMYVLCDEAETILPLHGASKPGREAVFRGAKLRLGHAACATRPRGIDPLLIANASHIFCFDLPSDRDRAYVADLAGVRPADIAGHLDRLEPRGFLWINRPTKQLTACGPIPMSPGSSPTPATASAAGLSASAIRPAPPTSSSAGSDATCGSDYAAGDGPGSPAMTLAASAER